MMEIFMLDESVVQAEERVPVYSFRSRLGFGGCVKTIEVFWVNGHKVLGRSLHKLDGLRHEVFLQMSAVFT